MRREGRTWPCKGPAPSPVAFQRKEVTRQAAEESRPATGRARAVPQRSPISDCRRGDGDERSFLPSNGLCNFASRQVTPVYCQRRSGKSAAARHRRSRGFVRRGDPRAGVELQAVGHRHAAAALNGGAHVGCGFQRLPDGHWEVSHAVGSVLKLSWGGN